MAQPAVASAGLPNNRHLSASPEGPGHLSEEGEEKDLAEPSPLAEELKRGLQRRQGLLLSRGGGFLSVGEGAVERGDGRVFRLLPCLRDGWGNPADGACLRRPVVRLSHGW